MVQDVIMPNTLNVNARESDDAIRNVSKLSRDGLLSITLEAFGTTATLVSFTG